MTHSALVFKNDVREVTYDEKIRTCEIKLTTSDVRDIITKHLRNEYQLGDTYEISISINSYATDVTITEVIEDE